MLYNFQEKILDDTHDYNRVAYYLDMGLGKTFIGAEKMLMLDAPTNIIVCQKSKIQDWIDHFNKYYPDHYSLYNLTDKKDYDSYFFVQDTQQRLGVFVGYTLGIINYELIFRRKEFLWLENYTLLLDESSLIQNDKAKRTKFILKLHPRNVILLSGTPTAGKYENLWSQLNLLGWQISKDCYNTQYVNWKKLDVNGLCIRIVDKDNPYKNIERLKSKMRDHGSVFLKTNEVYELPGQNIIEVKVKTTKEYRKFEKNGIVTIDGTELVGGDLLTKRLYLKMLCGHWNAEKLQAFRALCESTNDRLIVYYNYDAELNALKKICEALERPVSEINGHNKDLAAYEQDEDSITLVNYKAGAMGLNLQKSNKIIYFSLTEEAQLFIQSMKRIHRIGQDRPCFYYLLICQYSIEDKEILPGLDIRKYYTNKLFEGENHV